MVCGAIRKDDIGPVGPTALWTAFITDKRFALMPAIAGTRRQEPAAAL
jgi:hypothetical protein